MMTITQKQVIDKLKEMGFPANKSTLSRLSAEGKKMYEKPKTEYSKGARGRSSSYAKTTPYEIGTFYCLDNLARNFNTQIFSEIPGEKDKFEDSNFIDARKDALSSLNENKEIHSLEEFIEHRGSQDVKTPYEGLAQLYCFFFLLLQNKYRGCIGKDWIKLKDFFESNTKSTIRKRFLQREIKPPTRPQIESILAANEKWLMEFPIVLAADIPVDEWLFWSEAYVSFTPKTKNWIINGILTRLKSTDQQIGYIGETTIEQVLRLFVISSI